MAEIRPSENFIFSPDGTLGAEDMLIAMLRQRCGRETNCH